MVEISFVLSNGEVEFIDVDAVLEEQHRSTAMVSEHPVEDGSNISDHVRADQDTLTMEMFVTNTPIIDQPSANLQGAVSEIAIGVETPPVRAGGPILIDPGSPPIRLPLGIPIPGRAPTWEAAPFISQITTALVDLQGANVLQFGSQFNRVNFVYTVLRALLVTGTAVRIVTSIRTYENMVFEELTTPRSADVGDAIRFNVTARQIRVVDTVTVEAPPDPSEERGRNRGNRGGQQTDDASTEEEDRSSVAVRILSSLGL
jgi:hypothetical protein